MKKQRQNSINSKLANRFLLVGLMPMLCISIFQYYYSTNLLIQEQKGN